MAADIYILLDAGHGGVIEGKYQTPGKRAYFKDGKLMSFDLSTEHREKNCDEKHYEGEVNRIIRDLIAKELQHLGINFKYVNTGDNDLSLGKRVKIANGYAKQYGVSNCIFISIHSNGFKKESAHGYSFYTSIGQTLSDKYAEILYEEAALMFPDEKVRTDDDDGDLDKEANFYVLKNTHCTAVLGEMFFHTNYREYHLYLSSSTGQKMIADTYVNAIKRMVNNE
jgi:N-acetylmuramoyl-L-alanine amidase